MARLILYYQQMELDLENLVRFFSFKKSRVFDLLSFDEKLNIMVL